MNCALFWRGLLVLVRLFEFGSLVSRIWVSGKDNHGPPLPKYFGLRLFWLAFQNLSPWVTLGTTGMWLDQCVQALTSVQARLMVCLKVKGVALWKNENASQHCVTDVPAGNFLA